MIKQHKGYWFLAVYLTTMAGCASLSEEDKALLNQAKEDAAAASDAAERAQNAATAAQEAAQRAEAAATTAENMSKKAVRAFEQIMEK